MADVEELNSELTESQDSSKIAIRIRVDSLTKIAKIESIKEMNSTTFNNEFVLESLCFPIYRNFTPNRMDESGNLVSCERGKYLLFLAKQKKKNKNFFLLLFRFVDHPADSGDLLLEKIATMKKNGKISNFQDLKEVYGAYPLYHGK